MPNPMLRRRADKSVARALAAALKATKRGGKIPFNEVWKIVKASHDDGGISDVEFRDLKRILRQHPLDRLSMRLMIGNLLLLYPLKGPFIYPNNVDDLEGHDRFGNEQCAALVQHTIPIGLANTWREGIPVRGNGLLIKRGTAVATFEDGFYPNRSHDNHVAYYISQNNKGVLVMDQWKKPNKPKVSSRRMPFLGRKANGLYRNPSDNGDALSVIMKKA